MNNDQKSAETERNCDSRNNELPRLKPSPISRRLIEGFKVVPLPFLECDYDVVYPILATIIPKEQVTFDEFDLETATMAEILSAAVCHQINWDFLRKVLYEQIKMNHDWIKPESLMSLDEKQVYDLLKDYEKSDRLRIEERTSMIHEVAKWISSFERPSSVFLDENTEVANLDVIKCRMVECSVFSNDPEEKKMQLLFQKLSALKIYENLGKYCKPAIDYHLIRNYIRRGVVYPSKRFAKDYLRDTKIERREVTVGALRHLCSEFMVDVSHYTGLSISTINQIEWNIGRSICIEGAPDCELEREEASWLKPFFCECPFSKTCVMKRYGKSSYNGSEPTYNGTSY